MSTTRAIGNDGNITLPTGVAGIIRSWSADFTRVSSDVTGFEDASRFRRLGLQDVTGSAGGFPKFGATAHAPGVAGARTGTLTLTVATGCSYAPGVVFPSIAFNVTKDGDSALTLNFENGNGETITETWDEGS